MAPPANASGMEFEVFLSFRGSNTRDNFTSCLYHDMVEKGIRVFKDDKELRVGEKIEEVLQALNDSQIYIPIFSRDFADSPWCLREVARMVDCTLKSDGKKEILPLFFDVKPEDVRLRTELYGDALSKHEEKYGPDEVKRWEAALVEVATTVGWTLEGEEYGKLIKLIVRELLLKLKGKNRPIPDHLVETDDIKYIEELLDVDSNNRVRFVVIHGIGGIGKSTLASVIFNRFRSKFNCSSFLDDVPRQGLLDVQKKLLSDTLGSTSAKGIHDPNDGIDRIRRGLSNKRVLVVLDNVDEKRQLENLAGRYDWFGFGSRIIITVRDKSTILDKDNQTLPSYYFAYPVMEMPIDRALQLFSKHAFRRDTPPADCYSFSNEVVSSIGRLPLTLEVVGSLFANTVRSEWDETLEDLKQVPHRHVRKTLMMSINKLDYIEKAIFLDIACFCIGEDKTYVDYMWRSCGYSPRSVIDVLLLMSLIKIDEDNCFWMHDEVRDLGRYIVKEENFEDAGKRRWVWIDESTLDILRSNEEKPAVQALSLGISHDFKPEELACLPMLRFLGGERLIFTGDFKNLLRNLRWLSWRYCPLDFSATNLHLVNLVVLDLSSSDITHDWGGWRHVKMAKKLKILDLSWCYKLTKTPDFSEFGKLEKLILQDCWFLSTIDSSIGKLKLLRTLNINGCKSLEGLPEEIGSLECLSEIIMPTYCKWFELPQTLGYLKSLTKLEIQIYPNITQLPHSIGRLNLTHLALFSCENLHDLPESIGELESLVNLDLKYLEISLLPDSIGKLKNLKHLSLFECKNLHALPESIGELESLVHLDLKSSGIFLLPNSIGRLKNLKHLSLSECKNLHALPESIGELESLADFDLQLSGISILPYSIGRLKSFTHLSFFGCENLLELPDSIGELEVLVELNLRSSGISLLPDSIGRLKNLKHLLLSKCKNLHALPDSIGELEALFNLDLESSGISLLPDSIGRLKNLKYLRLFECKNLHALPESIKELKSLVKLNLYLSRISVLPDSIGKLTSLEYLSLSECQNLYELPDSIGELQLLVKLNLKLSGICVLPTSIGKLKNLKHLLLSKCKNLHELPESIGELESLVELDLEFSGISVLPNSIGRLMNFMHLSFSEHEKLFKLAHFVGKPKSLVEMDLKFSKISVLLDSIGKLTSLTHLSFSRCKNLYELPDSIGQMELLVELDLKSSGISRLPDSIGNLKRLKVLKVGYTKICTIPCALGGVETLEELDASFCPHLMDEIPWEMWSLTRLRILDLDGSPISTLPRKIGGFCTLQTLKIASHRLSQLPELPSSLKCLVVATAEFLVLSNLSSLVHLHHLEVRKEQPHMTIFSPNEFTLPWKDAQSIDQLPPSLSTLKLHHILQLPDIAHCQSLSFLSISECLMPCLPDLSRLKRLQELRLSDFPELAEIPGLGELELLKFLHIAMCDVIEQLPNLSKLKNLQRLELKHCAKLRAVEGLKELNSLGYVEIRYCMSLERLPDVPACTKLKTNCTVPKAAEHIIQSTVLEKQLRISES